MLSKPVLSNLLDSTTGRTRVDDGDITPAVLERV